jgi:hypothetical protein
MATSKKRGTKSSAQDNFIAPDAPTGVSASDVGTNRPYNNGSAVVTFTPATSGNAAAVTGYTVTSSPGGFTASGASSPITVSGLQSGVSYTFTVTAQSAYGNSVASSASSAITATTVPAAPVIGTATTVAVQDTVNWTISATGGKGLTGHTVKSSDGPTYSAGAAATSLVVAETANTSQTYQVLATNANGNSDYSASSNSVTTPAPFSPFSPFAPFGAFGFGPFAPFGFGPFGFGPFAPFGFGPFAPFGAFGFGPFGFGPFGAFGFGPFGAFGFSLPGFSYGIKCIDGETLVRLAPGMGTEVTDANGNKTLVNASGAVIAKQAKNISVGDTVLSASFEEIDPSAPDYQVFNWGSPTINFVDNAETTIVDIEESFKTQTLVFNEDESAQFTVEHPILRKYTNSEGSSTWNFAMAIELEIGDSILKYDASSNTYNEVVIEKIDIVAGSKTVYTFSAEPYDLIIAGDIVTHNK